jgi:hypothetical protein
MTQTQFVAEWNALRELQDERAALASNLGVYNEPPAELDAAAKTTLAELDERISKLALDYRRKLRGEA